MNDPPAHLIGRYDVVHIRLFISLVTNNDSRSLLDHCCKLLSELPLLSWKLELSDCVLEPGGYLQWEEFDIYSQEVISVQGSPTEHTSALVASMTSIRGLGYVSSRMHCADTTKRSSAGSPRSPKFLRNTS